jgi:hypothetical protein
LLRLPQSISPNRSDTFIVTGVPSGEAGPTFTWKFSPHDAPEMRTEPSINPCVASLSTLPTFQPGNVAIARCAAERRASAVPGYERISVFPTPGIVATMERPTRQVASSGAEGFSWLHRALAAALIVIGCLLAPLASVGVWTRREVLDTSSFKNLADALLAKQTVRIELADRIVRNLEESRP